MLRVLEGNDLLACVKCLCKVVYKKGSKRLSASKLPLLIFRKGSV